MVISSFEDAADKMTSPALSFLFQMWVHYSGHGWSLSTQVHSGGSMSLLHVEQSWSAWAGWNFSRSHMMWWVVSMLLEAEHAHWETAAHYTHTWKTSTNLFGSVDSECWAFHFRIYSVGNIMAWGRSSLYKSTSSASSDGILSPSSRLTHSVGRRYRTPRAILGICLPAQRTRWYTIVILGCGWWWITSTTCKPRFAKYELISMQLLTQLRSLCEQLPELNSGIPSQTLQCWNYKSSPSYKHSLHL